MIKRFALALLTAWACAQACAGEAVFTGIDYTGNDGGPAPGANQYRNPILAGFYPDPAVTRVGDDFYLVTSTFGYFPGLPVFHSRDLVSWRQIGNAIDRPGQLKYGNDELTRGLFAPGISHHGDTFYIVNTCFYCDGGNYLITAKDPAGPWSDPIWLGFSGIDPGLFFDDDGSAWMVNNDIPRVEMRYNGHRAIWLQQFAAATRKMIGPRTVLVDGGADPASQPEHIEGPHLFKRGGWYYLTAAEGGTGEQHAQMVWRSRKLEGPYLPGPDNPVLTQRDLAPSRNDPVTSTGHAQFVELRDGSWWAVFLATRPYRGNEYNLGRETFLLPVTWHDGWPMVLPRGERVPMVANRPALPTEQQPVPTSGPMQWSETFTADRLPLSWIMIHPPGEQWFNTGPGGLRLTPSAIALGELGGEKPAYLGHRLQHHRATITATLNAAGLVAGEQAGLALLQNETHFYALGVVQGKNARSVTLYQRAGKQDATIGRPLASITLPAHIASVSLRLQLDGPHLDALYATEPDQWKPVASQLDASILSTQVAGGFIGTTFGPYASAVIPANDP